MDSELKNKIFKLEKADPRYAAEAYVFVSEAVNFTVSRLNEHRHVTARELLGGMREFAEKEYGVLARDVLNSWGVFTASDIGDLVYNLIGVELLSASPGDKRSDFDIDYPPFPPVPEAISFSNLGLPKIDK